MKHQLGILLMCLFIAAFNGQSIKNDHLTPQQWRDDLHALYDNLKANHLNMFHFSSKEVFDKKYQAIYKEIPNLTSSKIIMHFKQFVSLVGDGHTMLVEPKDFRKYPLDFFIFQHQMILVRSGEEYKELLGLPLISINNIPIKRITDSLNTIISHGESKSYALDQLPKRLTTANYLQAFDFAPDTDLAVFEFLKAGKSIKVKIKATEENKAINWKWAYSKLPLFLSHGTSPEPSIFHKALGDNIYYINFSGYPSWEDFEKITKNIYEGLSSQKSTDKIIIDMRLNGGGNFDKGLKLMLPMFLNYNALHPLVKYYVIIGRATFSAGMSNAAHFRDCLNATLVGESTGAIPNGYQEIKWFRLPNSLLEVSSSQLFYSFQKKNTNGLQPDKQIIPSFKDYNLGNDPALNWILKR
ncbi:hypothetical protein C8J95_10214 [Elizabethkingia sp. YR214]|uniref:S41 family peptidase n=1 Tax=Elizabethkingia sp. YR214 TaxID=2135667 RepID=UPI000D4448B2|nr:S41 family peptidase [Elizabethkingia sp. YR214]PUB34350.1 hypothetical protein C8J95_10214 [Elizabethkingia sp. YR214]